MYIIYIFVEVQRFLNSRLETLSKIVFKKYFNIKNRIWLLSEYSSVLFNF